MACRAAKGFALSNFTDHVIALVNRAGQTMPDFTSVDALVSWVDSVGEATLKDIFAWEPQLAEVIVMPKRRRAK